MSATAQNARGGASPPLNLRQTFDDALPEELLAPLSCLGVMVALFDLAEWRGWRPEAQGLLSHDEAARVASRRRLADRHDLALTYALHRLLIGRALGCDASTVPLSRDSAGCPRLAGTPLSTSLSHAKGGAAAIAISASGPVGVDLEAASRAPAMHDIRAWVCHSLDGPCENTADPGRASEGMLGLWVRKEAYLKAAGVGLRMEMRSFPAPNGAVLPLPCGAPSEVRMLDAGQAWLAAIARAPGAPLECQWMHPRTSHAFAPDRQRDTAQPRPRVGFRSV